MSDTRAAAGGDPLPVTPQGLLNLFTVYLIWGSTYLAIRLAVRPGAGIQPFTLGFGRMLVAGLILLGWGRLQGKSPIPTRRELGVLAGSGLLLWTGANGMVSWAEQRIDSSFAAVLIATIPLWTVAIEALLDRELPSRGTWVALLLGFSGAFVLSFPRISTSASGDALSLFALMLAPLAWSLGSLLQRRNPTRMPARVSAGIQLLFAALGFGVLMLLVGEHSPQPTLEAGLAWLYLVIFGSVIGFTSYVRVLQLLPTSLAMTYAYVNPVIAVLLGVGLLGETLTLASLVGAALVLMGVLGVFRTRAVGH
jgi:drug/metabolite transporter (DMT)-like permease